MLKITMMIFFLILMFTVSIDDAYGQSSNGLSASTNKAAYQPGDKVIITGSVQQIVDNNPVTIIVRNPIGNVYEVGQVILMNNIFVHDFVISDNSQSGVYTITIKYGDQTSDIQFMVNIGQLQIIPIFESMIKVRGDNTTLIKYGNVAVSKVDNSISISADTSKLSNRTIVEEYQIPKQVIDAPGGQLIIKEDGNQIQCKQTETDVQRILDCPIQGGIKQLMFIGTIVIPEFGTTSMAIFALGTLTSLIVLSRFKIK